MALNRAMEYRTLESLADHVPLVRLHLQTKLKRLARIGLPTSARVLDVGSAQGLTVMVLHELGYCADGVEPSWEALAEAASLLRPLRLTDNVRHGRAEELPFPSMSFDLVHANSVFEHVENLEESLSEAHRVLKPGGLLWFNSASSMSPIQYEISGFPLFGWYPLVLKRRIMNWAKCNRPSLIGYTDHPAMHWFTPQFARRTLRAVGFSQVWDRWELRGEEEMGPLGKVFLKACKRNLILRSIADVCVPGCSFAAKKAG
jgi:SAM-dependent methyltransferase